MKWMIILLILLKTSIACAGISFQFTRRQEERTFMGEQEPIIRNKCMEVFRKKLIEDYNRKHWKYKGEEKRIGAVVYSGSYPVK